MVSGKVYLVGAGPGAADLLTVRAANVLARADIVFHDALINLDTLAHCGAACVRVPVGTRGFRVPNRRSHPRTSGRGGRALGTIVRLKGGDPGVFGRSGEERNYDCSPAGIPGRSSRRVSGRHRGAVTDGFPVTHRDVSSSVTLLTGSRTTTGMLTNCVVRPPHAVPDPGVLHVVSARPQRRPDPYRPRHAGGNVPCVFPGCPIRARRAVAPLSQIGDAVALPAYPAGPAGRCNVVAFWQRLHGDGNA